MNPLKLIKILVGIIVAIFLFLLIIGLIVGELKEEKQVNITPLHEQFEKSALTAEQQKSEMIILLV